MQKPSPTDIQRVMKVNKTLLELNYSWEEIEAFWKKCIDEAKAMKTNKLCLETKIK